MKNRFPRLHRFLLDRLTPGEALGLHLTIGVLLLWLAAWIFGEIATDVIEHKEITVLDAWLAHWLHTRATPATTQALLVITHWHGTLGVSVMATILALALFRRRAYYWVLAVAMAVPGGSALNVGLKHVFQRARPSFDNPLLSLETYSFPSGHTVGATLLYGVLAAYLVCTVRHWGARCAIAGLACVMVALVGLSRMALGVHYLSDVLAGVAEGAAWLAICITAVSTLRRRRVGRATNEELP
jgi:membrane-associated phospholipid phosphatase